MRYHYDDEGRMICNDFESEVWSFKEGMICSGCGKTEKPDDE